MSISRFIILLLSVALSNVSARSWLSVSGKSIEAELVEVEGDKVKLRKKGRLFVCSMKDFSKKDQDFLKSKRVEKKKGTQTLDASFELILKQEWPKLVKVKNELDVKEKKLEGGLYEYTTDHFMFISDAKLSLVPVRRFATYFEATRQYMKEIPLGMTRAYRKDLRHKVYLYEKRKDYMAAGGIKGSAGVYIGAKNSVLVPFENLGLLKKEGSKTWRMDYKRTSKTLAHEITHQVTDWAYFVKGSRDWFTEGLAEYIALTPYYPGKYSCINVSKEVQQYVTHFSKRTNRGRNLGKKIELQMTLKEYLNLPHKKFWASANLNYGVAALIVTYFIHYDGEGDANRLKLFLKSLRMKQKGMKAQEKLLDGRAYGELAEDIQKAWSKRGILLKFKKRRSESES